MERWILFGEGTASAFPPHSVGRWIARQGETVGWRRKRQGLLLATLGPIDPRLSPRPTSPPCGEERQPSLLLPDRGEVARRADEGRRVSAQ
ncbi:hypothetical protein AWH62_13860 [Maricaulis sp. W15]|nr:hypothetical protein AWH62_13860 [Maricaulis sp. W15]